MNLHFRVGILYTILALVSLLLFKMSRVRSSNKNGMKEVPNVVPRLPYLGNVIQVYKDPVSFMESCRLKYGDIFRVKLCRTNFVVVCNRQVAQELAKSDEGDLSLYEVLRGIYFERSCFDSHTHLAADALKKGISFQKSVVTTKLQVEALRLVKFLKSQDLGKPISHRDQLDYFGNYAARVIFRCFLGISMKNEMYLILLQFFALMKKAIKATHFVPMWMVHLVVRGRLLTYRHSIRSFVDDAIAAYAKDPMLDSSTFFRAVADKIDEGTGEPLTTEQIAGHLLAFLFAGTQNTGTLIQQVLADLALDKEICAELRAEVSTLIEKNDMDGILQSPLLTACLMEAARLYPTLFGLMRQCPADFTFAGHNLKKGDICSISNPMFMQDGKVFKDPLKYNPHRFMGENPEPCSSMMVTSWGSGVHLCPGKNFAIYEIKMAIAYLVNNFHFELPDKDIKVNYTSTGSFAERKLKMQLTPLPITEDKLKEAQN